MIHRDREAEAERLLADGRLSHREIARRLVLSRATVDAMANGTRPCDLSRRAAERREYGRRGPLGQCPRGCGRVELPCWACRVRDLVAAGRVRATDGGDPPDDRALTIDLRDEEPERYLEIRRRKEKKLLGAMLAAAEEAAEEDPQGDVEPSAAELRQIENDEACSPPNSKERRMLTVAYPAELPIDSVTELIRIVRAGTIVSERAAFGLAVWNVQGYAQQIVLGAPMAAPDLSSLQELQAVLTSRMAPEAIPPWIFALIAALIELLKQIL